MHEHALCPMGFWREPLRKQIAGKESACLMFERWTQLPAKGSSLCISNRGPQCPCSLTEHRLQQVGEAFLTNLWAANRISVTLPLRNSMKLDFKETIGDIIALKIITVWRKIATQKTTKKWLKQPWPSGSIRWSIASYTQRWRRVWFPIKAHTYPGCRFAP